MEAIVNNSDIFSPLFLTFGALCCIMRKNFGGFKTMTGAVNTTSDAALEIQRFIGNGILFTFLGAIAIITIIAIVKIIQNNKK